MKFRLPSFRGMREPIVVRCLKDRIKNYKDFGRFVVIIPRGASFDRLLVRSSRSLATLFENLEELYCTSTVIPKHKMIEENRALYRKLKGMECELKWKRERVFKRKAHFKPYDGLANLQAYIPELMISDAIWKTLNSDNSLMRLINAVKPEELSLTLSSLDTERDFVMPKEDAVYWSTLDSYYNPTKIMWEVRLTKILPRLLFYKKSYIDMYNLMDMICEKSRELTQQMIITPAKGG